MPPLRFGAVGCEDLAALVGLSSCLAGDAQGSSDLGPARTVCACCVDHETRCRVEGLSGVSQPLEVLHGPLWAASGRAQGLDRPTDPPPGMGAGLRAHGRRVNRNCRLLEAVTGARSETLVFTRNSISSDSNIAFRSDRSRRASGARSLISSYISRREHPNGPLDQTTENENDPREAGTSGGQITTTG